MNISDLIYELSEDYSDDFTEEYFNQFPSNENMIKNDSQIKSTVEIMFLRIARGQ